MTPADLWMIREILHLSQSQAARLVAVDGNTWARWERGEMGIHPARLRDLERLAEKAARKPKPYIGLGLGVVGIGGAVLGIVCLALMNMWAIFDPRMGQGIKGNLIRVILSLGLIGVAGGVSKLAGLIIGGGTG